MIPSARVKTQVRTRATSSLQYFLVIIYLGHMRVMNKQKKSSLQNAEPIRTPHQRPPNQIAGEHKNEIEGNGWAEQKP